MSRSFLTRRGPALLVLVALVAASAVVIGETATPTPAAAADDGSLDISFVGPDTILLGENATYTMSAFNNGTGADLYNLSWRVVLPAGASLVSADLGTPEKTINDAPTVGQTTLLWTNAEDLQVGVTKEHDFVVSFAYPTWEVALAPNLSAGAYASNDPRLIPDFNGDGTHNDTADTAAFDETSLATRIEAIRITKTEPNAESELLRGVHDEWTTYTLEVQNNYVNPTDTIVVEDYLPAGVEFLGCGSVDNTAATPITNVHDATTDEYGGSGALGVGVVPSNGNLAAECLIPDEVETVTLTADEQFAGQTAGVYTRVKWVIATTDFVSVYGDGDMDAGESFEIIYAAGIPLRQNAMFAAPLYPGSATGEMANLDNNTGALTADEQQWTNWSRATGNYHPGVLDMATQSEDSEVVIAEDLSIHKSVSSPTFVQGDVHQWSLLVETGEYRSASNLVITDQLPDGLCPLLIGSNPETAAPINAECDPVGGREPQVAGVDDDPDVVTENADGSWTLEWNVLPTMTVSDDFLVTFWTVARANYQENNADDLPVVGGDHWENTVDIIGTTTPRDDAGGNDIDRVQEPDTIDASQAGQATSTVVIDKEISQPELAGAALDCDTATWQAVGDANIGYKVGDRVCYRLNVDFTQDLDFRNPQVTDFIPPETIFEQFWGLVPTSGATAANTVEIDAVDLVDWTIPSLPAGRAVDAIVWDLGVLSGGDLFVDSTSKNFQVVFSVIVTGDPSSATHVDIVENLGKLTHQNSDHLGGETYSSRDLAGFPMTGPILGIDKRNAENGQPLTDAAETGVQGQVFDFSVTVSNDQTSTGTASIDDHSAATNIDVWDILPDRVDCADIAAISVSTGETATCYDPLDIGYPLTGQTTDGRSVIEYTVLSLAPATSSTLTYEYTVPANMAASVSLVNDAGVREYDTVLLNTGATNTVVPATNIDESKTPTTADTLTDVATVNIVGVRIAKGQTSSDTDADGDNRSGADSQDQGTQDATIGESITYRFDVTIPEGADLYSAVFSDPIDNEVSFVSLDGGQISTDNGGTWTTLVVDDAANGDGHFPLPGDDIVVSFDVPSETLLVTFPTNWLNPVAALDDLFWIEFTTDVDNIASVDANDNIDNYAYGDWNDADGNAVPQVASNRARTKVVEPSVTIVKTDDGVDTDVPVDGNSNVVAGQTVEYTLTVTNAAGNHNSDAYDLVVTDVLPLGTTFVAFDAGNPVAGTFTPDVPGGTEGTLQWTVAELDTGASIDLVYTATVDTDSVAATQLTNTADVTATSRAQDIAAEERTAANDPNTNSRYDDTTANTIELPLALITKDVEPFGLPDVDVSDHPVGGSFDFELYITIPSGSRTYDTTVFDVLPAFIDFDAYRTVSFSGTECEKAGTNTDLTALDVTGLTADGQKIGWYIGDVEADGANCVITLPYSVHIDVAATTASSGDNSATVHWHAADTILVDPTAVTDLDAEVWDETDGPAVETIGVLEPQLTIDKDVQLLDPGAVACEASPDADACDTVTGATHRFTVTVTNTGDGDAHSMIVVDTLPADGTGVPTNFTGSVTPTYSAGARTLTWAVAGPLAAGGGSTTFTYDITVTPSSAITDNEALVNTADVPTYFGMSAADRAAAPVPTDIPTYGGTRGPVTADAVTLTVEFPDLVIEKAPGPGADPTDARVGVPFTWELTVTNDGPVEAFNIDVDDVPPAGWLYDAGSAEIDTGGGYAPLADPTGGPTGPLLWDDVQASLAAGASFSIRYDLVPQASLLTLGTTGVFDHENDSGVAGEDASGATANETGSYGDDNDAPDGAFTSDNDTARIRRIDLSVAKSIVEAAPHHYGETITYRIVVTNDHPSETMDTATGVTVRDTLPAGVVFQSSSTANGTYDDGTGIWTLASPLADGASATLDIVVLVNSEAAIINHAEVETADQWDVDSTPGNWDDGSGTNEDDDDTVTFVPVSADLGNRIWFDIDADGVQDVGEPGISGVTVRATWVDPDGGGAVVRVATTDSSGEYGFDDLPRNIAIAVTVDTSTLPGGLEQTFELIDAPVLTDSQAANRQLGAMDHIVAAITLDAVTPSYPDVDFGYTGTGSIGDLVWHDDDDDGVVDGGELPIAGVDVIVTWGGRDGVVGDDISTSGVDESADDVILTATTDGSGSYLIDRLPEGSYEVDIDPATLPAGLAPTYDLDGGDDRTTDVSLGAGEDRLDVDFGERSEADVAITKTSAGEFAVGAENIWTITVANHGPANADGDITVSDTLPAGITFIRAESSAFACAVSGQDVTCVALGSIAAGEDAVIDLVVDVAPEAATGVTNTATVVHAGGAPDPDPTNETDDDTVTIPLSVLDIDKELVENSLVRDKVATWRITVTNYGPSPTTGTVTVVDDLPDGLAYVRAETDDMTCTASASTITCVVDAVMAVDATATVDVVTIVTATPGTEVSNVAEVFGGTAVGSTPIPEDVLDDVRTQLADDGGLDDALGIAVPDTGILDTAETNARETLAFTGTEPAQLVTLAMALFVMGIAFEVLARRRHPNLNRIVPD